jgi:predicted metal-dependent hydrolase
MSKRPLEAPFEKRVVILSAAQNLRRSLFTAKSMTFDWTHGPLAEGLRLYEAGEFFAAHEAWEFVWLTAPQPEKLFLQALIQVTVAFHHLSRNNPLGANRLLTAALRKLEPYPPNFAALNVAQLRDDIRTCLNSLATDPATQLAPPRIQPL